jgi:hypothetical protein
MLRPSFLLRRARSAWLLVACLMLSVLVTAALVSALLSFYSAALPATVTRELSKSQAMSVTIGNQASGSGLTRLIDTRMRTAFGTVPYRQYQATWSNELALPGLHRSGKIPAVEAAAMQGIAKYATLARGSWPSAPQAGRPIPAALPAAAAADLKAGIGTVLKLHYVGAKTAVLLEVTGLFRPRDTSAPYWQLSQLGSTGVSVSDGFVSYGPAVVSPVAFAGSSAHGAAATGTANGPGASGVPSSAARSHSRGRKRAPRRLLRCRTRCPRRSSGPSPQYRACSARQRSALPPPRGDSR